MLPLKVLLTSYVTDVGIMQALAQKSCDTYLQYPGPPGCNDAINSAAGIT